MALFRLVLSNFGKFDKPCECDITAGKHESNSIEFTPKHRVSRVVLIHGPCASGKSTLVNAVSVLRNLVLNPLTTKTEKLNMFPYVLERPAHLEIDFVSGPQMFFYTVMVHTDAVIEEKLCSRSLRPRSKTVLVYSRITNADKVDVRFGSVLKLTKSEQHGIAGNTLPNNTVLGGYLKTNVSAKLLDQVVAWFRKLVVIRQSDEAELIKSLAKDIKSNRVDAHALVSCMNRAGFTDIKSLVLKHVGNVPELFVQYSYNTGELLLPVSNVSSGTLKYLLLCYALMKTADGGVLIVDDIDVFLTGELVELFVSEVCKSKKTVQLIATARCVA